MKQDFKNLKEIPLFQGISDENLSAMLSCMSAVKKKYAKNQVILTAGAPSIEVGIVLSGSIHVVKEDFRGNPAILAEIGPGHLFGETYSFARTQKLPVTILSAAESEVLFIDYRRIVSTCTSSCPFHTRVIENLLQILAGKNILLSEKLDVMAKRTTREKLLTYLYSQANKAGSLTFMIPFNRQELANYLCVDRSAMSNELGRLRDEGILSFYRSSFRLHQPVSAEHEGHSS